MQTDPTAATEQPGLANKLAGLAGLAGLRRLGEWAGVW